MRSNSKKILSLFIGIILILGLLTGCNNNVNNEKNLGEAEGNNTVVAEVNGKPVTRGEVGEDLRTSEEEIISQYIYDLMLDEFLKDVVVTDTELELQLQTIKAQVGEESWPLYLVYYGGGSEDSFRVTLAKSLRQEKLITTKMENITVTEEELEEEYNKDPDSNNIAVLDVIFFTSVEELTKSQTLYEEGKTLEEIAEAMELTVSPNEHTYFKSDSLTWSKNFIDCSVGDYIFSNTDSGSLVIGRIVELNQGLDNEFVRGDLEDNLKYTKAYDEANVEYIEFLKSQKVTIMGQEYALYQEEDSTS